MDAIEKLSKYGTVKTCKEVSKQVVTIVLTEGFTENAKKTFYFLEDAQSLFPKYRNIETLVTEENLAILVLTK